MTGVKQALCCSQATILQSSLLCERLHGHIVQQFMDFLQHTRNLQIVCIFFLGISEIQYENTF